MFGISGAELMVVFLVALIVLGPDRLPVVARKAGQVLGELRKVSAGFEAEMRTAMFDQEPPARHSAADRAPSHPAPSHLTPNHPLAPAPPADPDTAADDPS